MSAVIAPSAATAPRRMSVWTAFWSLLGGGIVGLLAAGLMLSVVRAVLRLDDPGGRSSFVWSPFDPVGDWARAADLASLGLVVLACGLCTQRISRTSESELSLPSAIAAVSAVGLGGHATHSWWSLLAILPVAFLLRHAGRPPVERWSWRRRAGVAALGLVAYMAVVAAAFADLQLHPLAASPNMRCSAYGEPGFVRPDDATPGAGRPLVYPYRTGGIARVCLIVANRAWSRTATVVGVASGSLPQPSPWSAELVGPARPVRAGRQAQLEVDLRMTGCHGLIDGRKFVLRSIPLRVRVGGTIDMVPIELWQPIATACAG